MNFTLRALRHRNFAWFLGGQIFVMIGYWIQQIALMWLVYRLTGSATLLGVVAFASNLPILLLAPFVGLWCDRFNRHRMMTGTQVAELLQAVLLAALAFSGIIAVWHIVVLAILLGVCIAVELPVRHAFLPELLEDRADIPNAIALISLVGNCGRLIGPVLAGLLIGAFSEATCFLINALSYVAVLASLACIRVTPQHQSQPPHPHPSALRGIKEGVVYAWRSVPMRLLLSLLAAMALAGAPYNALMPAVVHEVYAGDAQTLGLLVGAAGMGAICGTLMLAARRNVRGLTRIVIAAAVISGCALIALSCSRRLPWSLLLMAAIGFSTLVISVSVNMILQTIVDDDKRGRVMSLYTVAFLGVAPLGGLLAGVLADHIGATHTVFAGGVVGLLVALYMASQLPRIRSHVRPIYARLGIAKSSWNPSQKISERS